MATPRPPSGRRRRCDKAPRKTTRTAVAVRVLACPFQHDERRSIFSVMSVQPSEDENHADAVLRDAFGQLAGRIGESDWARSKTPHSDLVAGFCDLATQPNVAADVATVLS